MANANKMHRSTKGRTYRSTVTRNSVNHASQQTPSTLRFAQSCQDLGSRLRGGDTSYSLLEQSTDCISQRPTRSNDSWDEIERELDAMKEAVRQRRAMESLQNRRPSASSMRLSRSPAHGTHAQVDACFEPSGNSAALWLQHIHERNSFSRGRPMTSRDTISPEIDSHNFPTLAAAKQRSKDTAFDDRPSLGSRRASYAKVLVAGVIDTSSDGMICPQEFGSSSPLSMSNGSTNDTIEHWNNIPEEAKDDHGQAQARCITPPSDSDVSLDYPGMTAIQLPCESGEQACSTVKPSDRSTTSHRTSYLRQSPKESVKSQSPSKSTSYRSPTIATQLRSAERQRRKGLPEGWMQTETISSIDTKHKPTLSSAKGNSPSKVSPVTNVENSHFASPTAASKHRSTFAASPPKQDRGFRQQPSNIQRHVGKSMPPVEDKHDTSCHKPAIVADSNSMHERFASTRKSFLEKAEQQSTSSQVPVDRPIISAELADQSEDFRDRDSITVSSGLGQQDAAGSDVHDGTMVFEEDPFRPLATSRIPMPDDAACSLSRTTTIPRGALKSPRKMQSHNNILQETKRAIILEPIARRLSAVDRLGPVAAIIPEPIIEETLTRAADDLAMGPSRDDAGSDNGHQSLVQSPGDWLVNRLRQSAAAIDAQNLHDKRSTDKENGASRSGDDLEEHSHLNGRSATTPFSTSAAADSIDAQPAVSTGASRPAIRLTTQSLRANAPVFIPGPQNRSEDINSKTATKDLEIFNKGRAHPVDAADWVSFDNWKDLSRGQRLYLKDQRHERGHSSASSTNITDQSGTSNVVGMLTSPPQQIPEHVKAHRSFYNQRSVGSPIKLGRAPLPSLIPNAIESHYGPSIPFKPRRTLANGSPAKSASSQGRGWEIGSAHPGWWYGWRGGDGREITFSGHGPDAERIANPPVNFHNGGTHTLHGRQRSSTSDSDDSNGIPRAPRAMREWANKMGYPEALAPCGNFEIVQAMEHIASSPESNYGWCHGCSPSRGFHRQ